MPRPSRFNQCATTGYLLAAIVLGTPTVYARTLLPGESETVTNPPAPEAWSVSQGGTLTINNANALSITSQNANVIFNGGQSERIEARDASRLSLSGATVNSSTGRGAFHSATVLQPSMPQRSPAPIVSDCCWAETSIRRPPPVRR